MSDRAAEFLRAWSLKRDPAGPIDRREAALVAARWEAEAAENGVAAEELHAAAGGELEEYLLRTFGERGEEFPSADDPV